MSNGLRQPRRSAGLIVKIARVGGGDRLRPHRPERGRHDEGRGARIAKGIPNDGVRVDFDVVAKKGDAAAHGRQAACRTRRDRGGKGDAVTVNPTARARGNGSRRGNHGRGPPNRDLSHGSKCVRHFGKEDIAAIRSCGAKDADRRCVDSKRRK